MRITPNSTIKLHANIPVDNGEELVFASEANRDAYFDARVPSGGTNVNCTVVRKSGKLKLGLDNVLTGNVVSTCNYLSFINPAFDNKRFYARIVDYDYVNNEVCEISYEIDQWLTWMFDITFAECYIEREHLSADEYATQEDNPYDPSLYMFRTPEPSLAISRELEKPMYDISSLGDDGLKIAEEMTRQYSLTNGVGTLVCLSEIDFEDLDEDHPNVGDTNAPSFAMVQVLKTVVLANLGFYKLTKQTYDYLNTKYPSQVSTTTIYRSEYGNFWSTNSLTPGSTSEIISSLGCNYIYFADDSDSSEALTLLLSALTRWSCLSSIVGMWAIPHGIMPLCGNPAYGNWEIRIDTPANDLSNYESKKLLHYPFSYVRTITPSNDVLELHYEEFQDVQEGDTECLLTGVLDISDKPSVLLAPLNYRINGLCDSDANILDGVTYEQFPTKPYTIDSYLAQVAANAQEVIANRTVDAAYDLSYQVESKREFLQNYSFVNKTLSSIGSTVSSMRGGLGTKMGGTGNVLQTLGDSYTDAAQWFAERGKVENAANKWMSASGVLNGGESAIIDDLRATRPAYACQKYVRSNGTGMLNFNKVSFFDFIILRVALREEVLERYDNYFRLFGYASGRNGIPHVAYYMGQPGSGEVPHWTQMTDSMGAIYYTTYIKTTDCKIIHSMMPVSEAISAMFNSGVRFIKGD